MNKEEVPELRKRVREMVMQPVEESLLVNAAGNAVEEKVEVEK